MLVVMTWRKLWGRLAAAVLVASIPAAADDRTESVGVWDVVAVEMNGKHVDPEVVSMLEVDYRSDGSWAVLFKGLRVGEGSSRIDQEASPKTFDLETLGGTKTRSRRYIGIYRQEGDARQFCFVIAGLPRPDAFTAPRGSGRILVTLERAGDGTHRRQGAGPVREGN